MDVFTVGHSSRTFDEFLQLLQDSGIQLLADVRRFPGSRRYPHFGSEQLAPSLAASGIAYRHLEALGGRRVPHRDSPNDAWRNPQFRGYADYMGTDEFRRALDQLIGWAAEQPVAVMCAEAVPWQCHRQLIADALLARGVCVVHLIQSGKRNEHELSPHARIVSGGRVVYPGRAAQLDLL